MKLCKKTERREKPWERPREVSQDKSQKLKDTGDVRNDTLHGRLEKSPR
jgi:hypothetical protein